MLFKQMKNEERRNENEELTTNLSGAWRDPQGHPFSRSYGVNLQSSFTSVLSSALEYSSRLPVSVLVRTRPLSSVCFSCLSFQRLRNRNCPRSPSATKEPRPSSRTISFQ